MRERVWVRVWVHLRVHVRMRVRVLMLVCMLELVCVLVLVRELVRVCVRGWHDTSDRASRSSNGSSTRLQDWRGRAGQNRCARAHCNRVRLSYHCVDVGCDGRGLHVRSMLRGHLLRLHDRLLLLRMRVGMHEGDRLRLHLRVRLWMHLRRRRRWRSARLRW